MTEKATAVFAVQKRRREEIVETWVELWVVEVASCYESEEACQRWDREGKVWVIKIVGEEVHEDLRSAQRGQDFGRL